MSIRIALVAALLSGGLAAPNYAYTLDWPPLRPLFSDVSGSVTIDSSEGHHSLQYGPGAIDSGDGSSLNVNVPWCRPTKDLQHPGCEITQAQFLASESHADGGLQITTVSRVPYPSAYSVSATWTGTLTNTFADSRSFQFRAMQFGDRLDVAVTVNGNAGVPSSLSNETYEVGILAPGASKIISMTMSVADRSYTTLAGVVGTVFLSDPVSPVPEPAAFMLFGAGLSLLGMVARRRKLVSS